MAKLQRILDLLGNPEPYKGKGVKYKDEIIKKKKVKRNDFKKKFKKNKRSLRIRSKGKKVHQTLDFVLLDLQSIFIYK